MRRTFCARVRHLWNQPKHGDLYINALLADGVIVKEKRGQYALAQKSATYVLKRSAGELEDDTYVYEKLLLPFIDDLGSNVQHIW